MIESPAFSLGGVRNRQDRKLFCRLPFFMKDQGDEDALSDVLLLEVPAAALEGAGLQVDRCWRADPAVQSVQSMFYSFVFV